MITADSDDGSIVDSGFHQHMSVRTSSTTSYGQLIEPHILRGIDEEAPILGFTASPQPLTTSLVTITGSGTESGSGLARTGTSRASAKESSQRTIEDVRDQVAQGIVIRTISRAEVVDGSRIGVVLTITTSSDPLFLGTVASKLKHALLTSSYLFVISMSASSGLRSVPVLVCGSSEEFVGRAALLINSKFLGRINADSSKTSIRRVQTDGGRWLGFIDDLGSTPFDEDALWDVVRKAARSPIDPLIPPPGSRGINEILAAARARLERIKPETAYSELRDAASPWPVVLVDIRPQEQRLKEGGIAGAMIVERNVLEWRFDPRSAHRVPVADRYDLRVIVFCSEGYTSSLAAACLLDLGLLNATDIIGGYAAWKQAGLPSQVEVVANGLPVEDYWSQSGWESRRSR